jgi:RNA recognition motif-containing protein
MYGKVIEASVPKNEDEAKKNNQNRGFGFVEFESREVA